MSQHHCHTKLYLHVWCALLVLTVITVGASYVDLGSNMLNITVAMLIATVKASLVIYYFMHMNEDTTLNRLVFFSGFFFLFIFVIFTVSDMFYREDPRQVFVPVEINAQIDSPVEIEKYRVVTDGLLAQGATVYAKNCASCHGTEGQGDGSASDPMPRNFTQAKGWTFERTPLRIFQTITEGSPGTSMSAFNTLSVQERMAVTHYIRAMADNAPDDTPEAVAAIRTSIKPPKKRIPISFAMERMLGER